MLLADKKMELFFHEKVLTSQTQKNKIPAIAGRVSFSLRQVAFFLFWKSTVCPMLTKLGDNIHLQED